jgi:anaerobic selenocysteine-containing dehydrogenase
LFTEITYRKYETDFFRKGGGFATPSGKVEIYSTEWKNLGYDPLPSFREPPESPYSRPDLAKKYPLVLTTGGRISVFFHSEFQQIEKLRKMHPFPLFQIHPDTATELGIHEGDWCWIETPRGKIKQKAKLFNGIDPRVIHAEHDWWYPDRPGAEPDLYGIWESSINVLTPNEPPHLDPGYGGTTLRGLLCRVYSV